MIQARRARRGSQRGGGLGTLGDIDTPSWVAWWSTTARGANLYDPECSWASDDPDDSTLGRDNPRVLRCPACRRYCAAEEEGPAGAGEPTPQRSPRGGTAISDPWRDIRTGIAAGGLPALPEPGQCADAPGDHGDRPRGPRQAVSATARPQGTRGGGGPRAPPLRSVPAPRPLRPRSECIRAPSRPPPTRHRASRPRARPGSARPARPPGDQPSTSSPRSLAAHS